MENRSSSSDADALASGGLAGAIDGPPLSPPPQPPPPPVEESLGANAVPGLEDPASESRDMMDVDVPPSAEGVEVEVESPVAPASPPPPVPEGTPPPPPDRTTTTPPPPPSRPRANVTPTRSPSTTTPHHHQQQQTPRDLRQILQAAGSIRTGFPSHGSVPPSPVVKPGALHEFEVSDPTSPATRRRSSATAGIAGLEELRNRIDAEKGTNRNGFKPTNGDAGPLDQLIQATTGAGRYVDGFGELLSDRRAHVIDAFVRLDFDDGHVFYVRNSSVVFGRAEGASSNSFQQLGPDGSTVIGSNPFGGFDPTTTPGAMSMKREKKKRRKKKGDASTGTPKNKSTTSGASSAGYPDSSRRNSAFAHRQNFPMFRDGSATNFSFPFPAPQSQRVDEVPIIHLPLATSDAETAAAPPKKNISRKHAVLNYNFAKRRFELKITGKNGAFVEDEFVHCDTTWVVGPNGMRVQIGGVGFKVVVPVVPGGGFGVPSKGGRGKGGKGKMSTSFTDEHGNEVQTDFSDEDDDGDEDEEMEQVDGSGGGSDESMEEASDESGDEGDEDEDGEDVEDDEEAQEGDVENSEGESEEEEESDEEAEATPPPPPPEPVRMEKKRGRGRPRKDEAEIARQELEKARAKEKVREKERRHKEKLEAAKRAKEVEREKERERKRQEEIKQKEERARQKERVRREKEQQKEQKKLHLPQPKQKEEPKKATKLYLPAPAAAKKEADKSLALQTKKGPGRPPKLKSSPPPPPPPPPSQQNMSMPPPPPSMSSAPAPAHSSMPELEPVFSPSNPLMAVAAFNATTPAIDPALYNSAPSYPPPPAQRRVSPQAANKPAREPKPKKEKPPVRKRTPSPEILESDYPPEALLKPAASYVILIHEAITKSEETALTLPQIYKAIERKYPYFKLRVTTNGWQSSVRHNLGAHKAFCKVTRSGKGWMWGINEGVSIEKEKNKANIAASRPPAYQPPPPQQPGGLPYQNGNGGYHQQQPNGYPVHNIGVPMYVDQNHVGAGRVPVYQQPQYQVPPQQSARIPPMPMAYQPPMQTASIAAPPVTASIGQANKQSLHQFPNAPIPPPAGNNPAAQQQPKQNGSPPEMIAAIQGLQKQLTLLASQNQGSAAGPSAPGSVSPAILAQAQQLLAGLISGKHAGRGASGNTDLVKQLTKAIQQGAGRNGAATAPVKSAPVVLPPAPTTHSAATKMATPTPMPAPAPAQVTAGMSSPRSGSAVDFKNLPPEQKKKLYRALLLAKEKKEREKEGLREAVSGTKRPLDDGGAGPVAKKVDVGGVGGSGNTA